VVRASLRAMPKLAAEEALSTVQRVACGTGSYSEDAQKSVIRRWTDAAGLKPTPKRPTAASLAAIGIHVMRPSTPQ